MRKLLIGIQKEKEGGSNEEKQREKERKATSGAIIRIRHLVIVTAQVFVE